MNKLLLDCVRFGFTQTKQSSVALTSLQYEAFVPRKNPLHLYPESPQKLHLNVQPKPPRHGLTAEYFSWSKPKETTKTDLPTISKWQIGLFLWQKPARRDAQRAQQGRKPCTGRSRGAAPGAPLVTFPATGKSPGVEGRSAPSWASSPHFGEQEPSLATCSRGGAAPRVGPFGVEGRSAPSWGCGGLQPPLRGAGAKSGDLLPRERSPSQRAHPPTEARTKREKGAQAPFSKTAAAPAVPAGRPPPPEQSG